MTYFFSHRGRSRLNPLPGFFDHSHGGTKCLLLIGGVAIFKLSIFYHFLPLWNLLKVCCISSDRSPPPKKKLLSVAPWFQNSIDINKTLLFYGFYCLFCLGKVSQKKPKELPLSGHVFPSWRLEVPSLQRSLLRARYSKVLKGKNMPFRIHQTSAPKLPWSWSPNPPRSILWCSGTTSSTWSQNVVVIFVLAILATFPGKMSPICKDNVV